MKAKIFKGAATALVTPMKPDGSISYETLSGLIDYQLKHHADAVVIGGTTGESASLSERELLELTAFTVKAVRGHILSLPIWAATILPTAWSWPAKWKSSEPMLCFR